MNATTLGDYERDFHAVLQQAGELLGSAARPFELEWAARQLLERQLRPMGRSGFGRTPPIVWFLVGRPGHEIWTGIQRYRLETATGPLHLVQVDPPRSVGISSFWAVGENDYRRLYRHVRQLVRGERARTQQPLLAKELHRRLWDNTVGFLRRDHAQLRRYGIPVKRGVLLTGEPGNGKTTACRWLAAQCDRFGFQWSNVTVEEYEAARRDGDLPELFQPSRPGIVFFDDFDTALRSRGTGEEGKEQITFRTELDGVCTRHGVVYVFTSNLQVADLDPALRRPGRIDQVIHFPRPDLRQRERFLRQRLPAEIAASCRVYETAEATADFSFAELEELRKLVVLRYLDDGKVDVKHAIKSIHGHCDATRRERHIGFRVAAAARDEQDAQPATVARI